MKKRVNKNMKISKSRRTIHGSFELEKEAAVDL